MVDLKMTLACWNYDRTRALMDGSVKPEGIDLTYHNSFPAATFHRMMGKREFGLGMVAKPYQNLVTLRVFEDGKVEWRPTADAPLQPAQLSSGEVAHLGTIIHSPAVRRLRRVRT